MSGDQQILKMEGFLTIRDYNTGEVLQEAKNAINYENMSEAIADTLSSRGYGEIYQMAFGNGGDRTDRCHYVSTTEHYRTERGTIQSNIRKNRR